MEEDVKDEGDIDVDNGDMEDNNVQKMSVQQKCLDPNMQTMSQIMTENLNNYNKCLRVEN